MNELTTRSDWEHALARVLAPVLEHASPGCAGIRLPGHQSAFGDAVDCFETFARSMWGAGPWLSTSPTGDLAGLDLAGFYRTGLVNGTDPTHPESWYRLIEIRQTLVEAAAVAWNVLLAKDHLWEPLSVSERDRVLAWLAEAARIPPYDCNWHLFSLVVQTALKALDGEYYQSRIDLEHERIEEFYVGDGWYDDFQSPQAGPTLDSYNAIVFHPYLLFWAHVDGGSQPMRRARVRERAALFLARFPYWFGSDGSFPCFGRSSTYRCAVLHAPLWGVLTGASPLALGQVRRLCRLATQRFLDAAGTFGRNGELTLGYTRSHPAFVEAYSGRGSPYWAMKAFSILALPPEHPFWAADEEPLPVELHDFTVSTAAGRFLVHGSRNDGQVQIVNAAGALFPKKYSNLSYSTHFGYELDGRQGIDDVDRFGDASLTLSLDGELWCGRLRARSLGTKDGVLLMESSYLLSNYHGRVRTISAVAFVGDAQLRVHRVDSERPVYAREGGFACGWNGEATPVLLGGTVSFAAVDGRASAVRPLCGYDLAPEPATSSCNVLYPNSALPCVRTERARQGSFYLAAVSLARAVPFEPSDVPDVDPAYVDALVELIDDLTDSSSASSAVAMRRSGTR